jgi:hypothetical protein
MMQRRRLGQPGDQGDGRTVVDLPPKGKAAPTWKEFFIYTANFTGTQALPAGTLDGAPGVQAFQAFDIKIDSDADFEFLKSVYTFTSPKVYVRYEDQTQGRRLHRGTLDLRMVAGGGVSLGAAATFESTAFLPFIWPQAHLIPAASVFEVNGADFSGFTNTVRLSFHGNKVRPGYSPWEYDPDGRPKVYTRRLPYTYALPADANVAALAASATIQASAPIDMEADFLATHVTAQAQGAYTILLEDAAGRERRWSDTPVHISNFAGNGFVPMRLPSPRFFYRGGSILATVSDLSAATNRWRVFIHGVKLYE